jgi:RNA polymerase sigma-70 factor (ECF subfamily)
MDSPSAVDIDSLLRHDAWLRAFVQRLAARDDADDVVQHTWLAALLRPVAARDLRAWLAAVAANFARTLHRGGRRRTARERDHLAGGADCAPSTADTVARLELQRLVAGAVCALPEPTRSVLLLHYHDGLAVGAIAQRLGMSEPAARKRLQRGRDAVREALARDLGPDWRSLGAVVAFADRAPWRRTLRTAWRPLLLSTTALVVAGAAIGMLAAGGATPAAAPRPTTNAVAAVATTGERQHTADVAAGTAVRERVEPQGAQGDGKPTGQTTFVGVRLRGRCVAAESGAPLAGVKVTARGVLPQSHPMADSLVQPSPKTTGADGSFEVAVAIPAGFVDLSLESTGRVQARDDFDAPRASTTELGDVAMRQGYPLRGRVLDERSQPVPKLDLETPVDVALTPSKGTRSMPATTDDAGRFHFECLPPGRIELRSDNQKSVRIVANEFEVLARPGGTEIEVRVVTLQSISGVVFDDAGRPAADVDVSIVDPKTLRQTGASTRSRADGSFELSRPENSADEARLETGRLTTPFEPTLHPDPVAWNSHGVRLRAVSAAAIAIVVRDDDGKPVERFRTQQAWEYRGTTTSTSAEVYVGVWRADGTFHGYCVRRGTTVFTVVPTDRSLSVGDVRFDGASLPAAPVELRVARLQPLTAEVVDAAGKPRAGLEVDVLDMRGTSNPDWFDDWRTGRNTTGGPAALRHATGKTGTDGKVALAAPRSCRDLQIVVRTKPPFLQPLTELPGDGQPLRVTVPAR